MKFKQALNTLKEKKPTFVRAVCGIYFISYKIILFFLQSFPLLVLAY